MFIKNENYILATLIEVQIQVVVFWVLTPYSDVRIPTFPRTLLPAYWGATFSSSWKPEVSQNTDSLVTLRWFLRKFTDVSIALDVSWCQTTWENDYERYVSICRS